MVKKILLKYTLILVINLFAFLVIGYILDKIFGTNGIFITICLILSVISLVVMTQSLVGKNLSNIEDIKKNIKNNNIKK